MKFNKGDQVKCHDEVYLGYLSFISYQLLCFRLYYTNTKVINILILSQLYLNTYLVACGVPT